MKKLVGSKSNEKRNDSPGMLQHAKHVGSAFGGDLVVEGWLNKWTNYMKGHRERWFVLNRSLLSYYRSKEEMGHTCRGTINIYGAVISFDKLAITISTGTQFWHLKAQNETQLSKWRKAFEVARSFEPVNHNDSPGMFYVLISCCLE